MTSGTKTSPLFVSYTKISMAVVEGSFCSSVVRHLLERKIHPGSTTSAARIRPRLDLTWPERGSCAPGRSRLALGGVSVCTHWTEQQFLDALAQLAGERFLGHGCLRR